LYPGLTQQITQMSRNVPTVQKQSA